MTKGRRNYKGKQRRRSRRYTTLIESTINPLPYLPENIIEEILLKLPAKAMARFKLVCKIWNSIISSPKFIDYYNKNLRQREGNHLILFERIMYGRRSNINGCKFYVINPTNGTRVDTEKLEYYTQRRCETELLTFLGSCNGLVAILCDTKLILWNPLTNEQSFIQVGVNIVLEFKSDFDHHYSYLFGFCYDSSKDEYVVIVGFELLESGYDSCESETVTPTYGGSGYIDVYFYNFKYGSERRCFVRTDQFRLLDWYLPHGDIGKVICGLPHWVIQYCPRRIVNTDIVYFDLNEEMFKIMAQPNASDDKTILGLATLDGENQLGCVVHDIGY
ncbi:putative F-box protein At3g22650 [Silene latifolia]|uniref:putative F-box protein At3g22650 n=1 Tax=Silene latifolia TaxID=37657 RepID=UPI003D777A0B